VAFADKGQDADWIRRFIEPQDAAPNIPMKSNRRHRFCFSHRLYQERNKIKQFFGRIKQFRRIATRYDKLASNYIAMVKLAAIRLWLRAYGSTT
jgi:transposase